MALQVWWLHYGQAHLVHVVPKKAALPYRLAGQIQKLKKGESP
jgi:hypothetical protein